MGGFIELSDGPSGRTPIVAVSLAEQNGVTPDSHLVLFKDGTLGTKMGENPSLFPLFGQSAKSFDGSEYAMMYHSPKQFGKIEKTLNDSRIPTYLLRFTIIIGMGYFALFLYYRTYLEWPPSLSNATSGYLSELLLLFPLIFYWTPHRIFDFSAGEIKVYQMETDPHVFPIASETSLSINTVLSVMYALLFGCLFAGELYCDLLLLLFVGYTMINHVTEEKFQQVFVFKKEKLKTATVGIEAFCIKVDSVMRDLQQKERLENPLLNLLMDDESPTLEFKASLWAIYRRDSGELVKEQKEKFLDLQDAVLKTIAAFLNTDGGTLLIGVKDKTRGSDDEVSEVLGIHPDFKWLKKGKQDTEGYEQVLIQLFNKSLTNPAANQYITINFPVYENLTICRIDVDPLPRQLGQQCFTTTSKGEKILFVRSGDSSIPQSIDTQYHYIRHHFEGYPENTDES